MWATIFNKKALKRLAIAMLIVLVAVLTGYFLHHHDHRAVQTAYAKKTLTDKFSSMDRLLSDASQMNEEELLSAGLNPEIAEAGISILLYYDGELIYWSDNSMPVDYFFDNLLSDHIIVQLGNGYYLASAVNRDNYTYVGLLLLKHDYGYQNEYIRNEFNPCFKLPEGTGISFEPMGYDLRGTDGEYLFSLIFPEQKQIKESASLLLLGLYIAALILIVSVLHQMYRGLNALFKGKKWVFALFAADVILIRIATFYFEVPAILYESRIFGPGYLAVSSFLPSLGDLVVNALVLLLLAWYFYKSFTFRFKEHLSGPSKWFTGFTLLFHVFIFFHVFQLLLNRIVFDSVISFNLVNIFGLTIHSLLGFIAIAAMLLAYFFIGTKLCMAAMQLFTGGKNYIYLLVITSIVAVTVSLLRQHFDPLSLLFVIVFILSFLITNKPKAKMFTLVWVVAYLVAFSLISAYLLKTYNTAREKQERKLIAIELAAERDRIAEYRFKNIRNEVRNDEQLQQLLYDAWHEPELETDAAAFMLENFFDRYWNRFNLQATLCYPGKELHIRPGDFIVDCESYFEGYIRTLGETTDCEDLYYIFPGVNYLARLDFSHIGENMPLMVYVEINSKAVAKGLGYPELLIDEGSQKPRDIYNYAYATFVSGELIRSVGRYPYTIRDFDLPDEPGLFIYFDRNQYSHLLYNASPTTRFVVSRPRPVFADIVAPFSYLFIFFGLFAFLFSLFVSFPYPASFSEISFRNRVQYAMFGIVLVSFLITGISSLVYISRLNQSKNINILSEKNHSVLIELEQNLAGEDMLDPGMSDYLDDLLTRYSLANFTDINLYDPQGWLIASSRPQIFEEGLISARMHPEAWRNLSHQLRSSFIHQEAIGSYRYLSSYLPLRNDRNELIAYVNLPYFAKQSELRQEISNFLVAFTNIYVVLMAISLFLALLLSDYLLRPLMLLKANLRKVKLSESTHKIHWKGKDEISELIGEYNRMTDELVKSAEMLARSERESAWREMAKQVAHEIKNPLTPMKLSVQYLQKAWNEKAPDWDERLKRFAETLTHQIDTLSEIASTFSDFATMPAASHEKVNLIEITETAVALYNNIENISINLKTPENAGQCIVLADKRQMLRVFNNLIKNSVQAIGNAPGGRIDIEISRAGDHWQVQVYDNGAGISSEQQEKIFSPYFTTKSSGMGLGLAIVKNIISGIGGAISFQSEEKSGTTFRIMLPVYDESQ